MGKAVARPDKTKADRLLEAQRALEMHIAGVDDVHICAELRISRSTLQRRIRWALTQVVDPTVAEYRQEAAARLRLVRRTALETITRQGRVLLDPNTGELVVVPGTTPSEVAALLGKVLDAEVTEAKLRGGFAPTAINVRHTVEDALDRLLEELNATAPPTTERQETPA